MTRMTALRGRNERFAHGYTPATFGVPAMAPVGPKIVRRRRIGAGSVGEAVTSHEEVRPMKTVGTWALPLVVTVWRLT